MTVLLFHILLVFSVQKFVEENFTNFTYLTFPALVLTSQ